MAMSKTPPVFEIYADRKGEFRWRARARNGNLLAAASEGYVNKRDAVHCAKLFGYDPSVPAPEPKKVAAKKAPAKKAVVAKAPAPAAAAKPTRTPRARAPKAVAVETAKEG